MRRSGIVLTCLAFVFGVLGASRAQDDPVEFAKARGKAIDKGIEWLKKQQQGDGTWNYDDKPFTLNIHMLEGSTALALYALLKAGVEPKDKQIDKGFEWLRANAKVDQVYSTGCILLALDARYNWEPPIIDDEDEPGEGTKEKKKKEPPKKIAMPGPDKELAQRCVDFLTKAQQPEGSWRYMPVQPGGPLARNDASNPQYALLGLDAATRLGCTVSKDVFVAAARYYLEGQEADGAEVPSFPVPGADLTFKELKAIEKQMKAKIKQIEADFKGKKSGDVNKVGHTEDDERKTVEREASDKIYKTGEKLPKMHARGWPYMHYPKGDAPQGGGTQGGGTGKGGGGFGGQFNPADWQTTVTGSMTTSGIAALLICKAQCEGIAGYDKELKIPVNKAIRDGAAWMAVNFSVTGNPKGRGGHHYYYMYGLERAGMIGLIPRFAENDWYAAGSRMFVKAQREDGSWDAGMNGTSGPVPDSCWALLFLSKGTTPVVRIPNRTATGGGGGGGGGGNPQAQPQEPGGEGK
jgi:hypothetical protein